MLAVLFAWLLDSSARRSMSTGWAAGADTSADQIRLGVGKGGLSQDLRVDVRLPQVTPGKTVQVEIRVST